MNTLYLSIYRLLSVTITSNCHWTGRIKILTEINWKLSNLLSVCMSNCLSTVCQLLYQPVGLFVSLSVLYTCIQRCGICGYCHLGQNGGCYSFPSTLTPFRSISMHLFLFFFKYVYLTSISFSTSLFSLYIYNIIIIAVSLSYLEIRWQLPHKFSQLCLSWVGPAPLGRN